MYGGVIMTCIENNNIVLDFNSKISEGDLYNLLTNNDIDHIIYTGNILRNFNNVLSVTKFIRQITNRSIDIYLDRKLENSLIKLRVLLDYPNVQVILN